MGKPKICICENKDADQLRSYCEADLRLSFRNTVQFTYFLNQKFPVSSYLLCLYSMVCVRTVRKPHCWFSHVVAHLNESNLVHPATAPLDLKPWKHTPANTLHHSENYMQISADGGGVFVLHPTPQPRSYGVSYKGLKISAASNMERLY